MYVGWCGCMYMYSISIICYNADAYIIIRFIVLFCAGIFSPVDPNLVTPLSRHHPIATVAMPTSAALDNTTYTYRPAHAVVSDATPVTPLPSSQQQPLTSSSTPITTGPVPACSTPSLSVSTETSGLFSPLDSSSSVSKHLSSRQPVASPLLIAHTKASAAPSVENVLGHMSFPKNASEASGHTRKEGPASLRKTNSVTNEEGVVSSDLLEAPAKHGAVPKLSSLCSDKERLAFSSNTAGGMDYPDSLEPTSELASVDSSIPTRPSCPTSLVISHVYYDSRKALILFIMCLFRVE